MPTQVTTTGPLFSKFQTERTIDQFINAAVSEGGRRAEEVVDEIGYANFKNPTGNWRSHLQMRRPNKQTAETSVGNLVYGAWLEGVSRRNRETRFKGYFMWRKTTQRLQNEIVQIAEDVLRRYIRKLG